MGKHSSEQFPQENYYWEYSTCNHQRSVSSMARRRKINFRADSSEKLKFLSASHQ